VYKYSYFLTYLLTYLRSGAKVEVYERSDLRPLDESREVFYFAAVPFDSQTLISQTAEWRSAKNRPTSEVWSERVWLKLTQTFLPSPPKFYSGSKSAKCGLDFLPQSTYLGNAPLWPTNKSH